MVENPPENMPRITPYLHYHDVAAAISWLQRAFGFTERFSMPDAERGIIHAEMTYAEGVIMLGPVSEEQKGLSPRDLSGVNQSLYIYVNNLNRHYIQAKEAKADIVMEPETMFWGDRIYAALDLEGHQWTFAQHVEDVSPEAMQTYARAGC